MADLNQKPENSGFTDPGEKDHRDEYMNSDYVLNRSKMNLMRVWSVIYPVLLYSLIMLVTMYFSMMAIIVRDMMIEVGPIEQLTVQEYQDQLVDFMAKAKTDVKMRAYYETFEAYSPMVTFISNMVALPVVLILLIWDEFWKNRRKMMYIRQNPEAKTPAEAPPSDDFLCVGLSLIFGVGMCLAANLFVSLLKLGGSEVSAAASSGRTYGVLYEIQNSVLFQIVSVVIVAATVEELLFRGVIFRRLCSGGGIFFPVLISSMIYASFYGTAAGFVFGFLVAVGAAYLYYRTRNLKTPVFYHIFLNAMTLVFTLLGAHTNAFFGSTRRVVLAFLIGLVLLAFAIIFIEYYLPKVPKEPEKGEK